MAEIIIEICLSIPKALSQTEMGYKNILINEKN